MPSTPHRSPRSFFHSSPNSSSSSSSSPHDADVEPLLIRARSSSSSHPWPELTETVSGFSLAIQKVNGPVLGPIGDVLSLQKRQRKSNNLLVVSAATQETSLPLTGVIFQPFEEVKSDAYIVPISPQVSLARQRFKDESEATINEQINVEYTASYVYHAMYAYFDRDNIALKGLAKFFKESSEEEREHAEKLMMNQNIRGGRVKLHSILLPPSEFDHEEKGDALYAMELALALEKLTNEKLLSLHSVAEKNGDPQLADFVASEFLGEQVESIKKISEYVTQLRMVGKGHGIWHFDQALLN